MTVNETQLWSDFEAFPMEFNENDSESEAKQVLESNECDYTLFELLLNDLKEEKFVDFLNLDWKCLSAMKGFSLKFIRENFRYFDVFALIINNNFDESFLVEILDKLIPFNEKQFNKIFDKARILNVCKQHTQFILSDAFNSRVYPVYIVCNCVCKYVCKTICKQNRAPLINVSFENIVNYLKQEHPKEYLDLDVKCFSSFRQLSTNFVLEHIHKLDINMLFTNQKFDLDFIKKLNQIVDIPFNPLFVSHIKQLSLEFILELIPFEKTVRDKKNRDKIKKFMLMNILPSTFNKSSGTTVDDSCLYKCKPNVKYVITSYENEI